VGGVSGRPAQETKRSDPLPCLLPRRWKAPWSTGSVASFAGCRKSMGLDRFVLTCVTGLFPHVRRTDDKRVSSGRTRRGTSSAYAKRTHSTPEGAPATRPPQLEDTSFARSRDPCTSNATELGPVKSRKGWRGRFGIAVGQTWATRRNRHRDWDDTDECAACRPSPPSQGGTRDGLRKGRRSRPSSLQGEARARVWLLVRRM
jgi:hypothetical protein